MELNACYFGLLALILCFASCNSGQFWHISDLHLDYHYKPGTSKESHCHNVTEADSDVGPAGSYFCDAPFPLVDSALGAMANIQPNVSFIVWTGDSGPHWGKGMESPKQKYILNVTKRVFTKLDRHFPNVPVVPALGNHDADPPDQFPVPPDQDQEDDGTMPVDFYKDLWNSGAYGDHIPKDQMDNFQKCGYFTRDVLATVDGGLDLKFIVLNTNIYYHDKLSHGPDPCSQMAWFNKTLSETDATKTKLMIVAHVPPGGFELKPGKIFFSTPEEFAESLNNQFVSLMSSEQAAAKVSAHLYGHLHTDTFRLFLDTATRRFVRGVAFMVSSVTPLVWGSKGAVGTNPAIKLFTFDDKDYTILDYEVFSLDLDEVNSESQERRKRESMEDGEVDPLSPIPPSTVKPGPVPVVKTKPETEAPKGSQMSDNSTNVFPAVPGIVDNSNVATNSSNSSLMKTDSKVVPDNIESNITMNNTDEVETTTIFIDAKTEVSKIDEDQSSKDNESSDVAEEVKTQDDKVLNSLVEKWKPLYKASESFGVANMTADSMFSVYKKMVSDGKDGAMFKNYVTHNTANRDIHTPDLEGPCGDKCWRNHLCAISNLEQTGLTQCIEETDPGVMHHFYVSQNVEPEDPESLMDPEVDETEDNDDYQNAQNSEDNQVPEAPTTTPWTITEEEILEAQKRDNAVTKVKMEDLNTSLTARAVSIFLGVFGCALLVLLGLFAYKKYKDSRYRNQEFLLTDSVFRYDGYSQLEDD